jgi:hypothetical protein
MEILHPVAVTIFGGLIVATTLDTLVTPLLIWHLGREPIERLQETSHNIVPETNYSPIRGQHDLAY